MGEQSASGAWSFFVVLETQTGTKIVAERCLDGALVWKAEPEELDERCSLAKVLHSSHCDTTLHDLKYSAELTEKSASDARSIYGLACGQECGTAVMAI